MTISIFGNLVKPSYADEIAAWEAQGNTIKSVSTTPKVTMQGVKHGTRAAYVGFNCQCFKCLQYARNRNKRGATS